MMKGFLLTIVATLFAGYVVSAAAVSTQTAQTIAVNFIQATAPGLGNNVTANLVYTKTESDGIADFYVFNLAPAKGFVIVSANNNAQPVIAYSTESYFNAVNTRFGLSDWINTASAKLHAAVVNNIPASAGISYQWNAYMQGQNPNVSRAAAIGPLCTTTWNQEPYYNSLCPFNATDNQLAVTGCVATTMAQIMKYWNYPAQGTGSYSYTDAPPNYSNNYGTQSANFATPFNWAAMANAVTSATSPVDSLMYLCAVSVAMNFGDDNQGGSGAVVLQTEAGPGNPCAQYSFANYFFYNPNTLQGVKMSAYSTPDWINLMENELNSGRVIQYEGNDPTAGGHTWVCDGYEANGMLHMNWGWGGSANGYYAVGDLSAGGYTFSQNDAALIGIEPLLPVTLSITSSSPAICAGGNATLTAHGPAAATFTWSPSTGLSCTNCAAPVATPTATTLYTVTADSAGVQAKTSMAVVITPPVLGAFNPVALPGCALPENVTFTNTSTSATNYLWDFGDGTTDTSAEPVHGYGNQGSYTIRLYVSNACGADTVTKTQSITGGPPASADVNICAGNSIALRATGLGTIGWYSGANVGTSQLTTGTLYTTPVLSTTTTYYVADNITPAVIIAGPLANTVGSGSYSNRSTKHGMFFNNTVVQNLVSVDVYTDSAGVRSFMLQDSTGNTIDSMSVSLTSGHRTVTFNWSLPVENNLQLCSSGFCYMYRNSSGVTFPYNSSDGTLSITGNTSNIPGALYYFYNWKVQQPICQTLRTPVTVFVLGTGGDSFRATGTGTPAVSFYPADTNATAYSWSFGDGGTSTLKNPEHTYSAAGNYSVQLIVSSGGCSDTVTQSFNTIQLGINTQSALSNFNIFPNPAKDQVTLLVNADHALADCHLSILNILGQPVYNNTIEITEGANNLQIDISKLTAGMYIVSLQNGKDILNTRLVKSND